MMLVIRLPVAVATLAVLSSIPAAGQAPKLSPQQLNPPTLSVNKPIAAPIKPITVPKALTAVSPSGNKQIAAPGAYSSPNLNKSIVARRAPTFAFQHPKRDVPPLLTPENTSHDGSNIFGQQDPGPNIVYPPCPGGAPRSPLGYC